MISAQELEALSATAQALRHSLDTLTEKLNCLNQSIAATRTAIDEATEAERQRQQIPRKLRIGWGNQ